MPNFAPCGPIFKIRNSKLVYSKSYNQITDYIFLITSTFRLLLCYFVYFYTQRNRIWKNQHCCPTTVRVNSIIVQYSKINKPKASHNEWLVVCYKIHVLLLKFLWDIQKFNPTPVNIKHVMSLENFSWSYESFSIMQIKNWNET